MKLQGDHRGFDELPILSQYNIYNFPIPLCEIDFFLNDDVTSLQR